MLTLKKWWHLTLCLAALLPGLLWAGDDYTVVKGDSLWRIAARPDVLGDPWQWPMLFEANRGRLLDPDRIEPGTVLKVPVAPSSAQIAGARLTAQLYKEAVPVDLPAAPSRPDGPPDQRAQTAPQTDSLAYMKWVLLLFAISAAFSLLLMAWVAVLAYRRWGSEGEARVPAQLPPTPVVPEAPALPQPTESEAILRAEAGPDPLHHEEDHPKAA